MPSDAIDLVSPRRCRVLLESNPKNRSPTSGRTTADIIFCSRSVDPRVVVVVVTVVDARLGGQSKGEDAESCSGSTYKKGR